MNNGLTLKVFSSGTTEVVDVDRSLANAVIESFGTFFPGGLFGTARIFCQRDVTRAWQVREGQRVAIYSGLKVVWEGEIAEIAITISESQMGMRLECSGKWGSIMSRTLNKVWADIRLNDAAWPRVPQGDYDNMVNIDRDNRIGIGPQVRAWTAGDVVAAFRYTMPTGQTIKRIKATLKNRESGQDWITRVRDTVGAATLFSETGDGVSTATDHTLATPRQYVEFQFVSNANQTPTIAYGRMSVVTVYSETGGITPTSIVKNIRAALSDINSDETNIASNTFTLEPFMTNGQEAAASVVQRAAAFGDASFNPWAVYFDSSDKATAPDGNPVLCFQAYPVLTDYDYAIRMDEKNLLGAIEIKRAVNGSVYNWIAVRYRDELANRDVILTPDDDATLKDTTSIARWGQRDLIVNAGTATATTAKNYAKRMLAYKKNATYRVTSPIEVQGWLRTKNSRVTAAEVRAGKRLRIENFLTDEVGVDGAGLTFIVTGTEYDPARDVVRISMGVPDHLGVFLARNAFAAQAQY